MNIRFWIRCLVYPFAWVMFWLMFKLDGVFIHRPTATGWETDSPDEVRTRVKKGRFNAGFEIYL